MSVADDSQEAALNLVAFVVELARQTNLFVVRLVDVARDHRSRWDRRSLGSFGVLVDELLLSRQPSLFFSTRVAGWFGDAFRANQKATVDRLVKVFLDNNVDCYVKTCEMLGDGDLRAGLATIKVPTAVAVGEEDYATPVAMAEALHKGIAGSTLTVLPGGRHITPTEKPQDIAARFREVIAKAQ